MKHDSAQLRELEHSIAERIYIEVEKWNLYLGDAGLSEALAMECVANLEKGIAYAALKAFDTVSIKLGGGKTILSLSKVISSKQISELEDILESVFF